MKKPKQFIVSVTLQKKKKYKHIYHNIKIKANWENKLIKKKGKKQTNNQNIKYQSSDWHQKP